MKKFFTFITEDESSGTVSGGIATTGCAMGSKAAPIKRKNKKKKKTLRQYMESSLLLELPYIYSPLVTNKEVEQGRAFFDLEWERFVFRKKKDLVRYLRRIFSGEPTKDKNGNSVRLDKKELQNKFYADMKNSEGFQTMLAAFWDGDLQEFVNDVIWHFDVSIGGKSSMLVKDVAVNEEVKVKSSVVKGDYFEIDYDQFLEKAIAEFVAYLRQIFHENEIPTYDKKGSSILLDTPEKKEQFWQAMMDKRELQNTFPHILATFYGGNAEEFKKAVFQ